MSEILYSVLGFQGFADTDECGVRAVFTVDPAVPGVITLRSALSDVSDAARSVSLSEFRTAVASEGAAEFSVPGWAPERFGAIFAGRSFLARLKVTQWRSTTELGPRLDVSGGGAAWLSDVQRLTETLVEWGARLLHVADWHLRKNEWESAFEWAGAALSTFPDETVPSRPRLMEAWRIAALLRLAICAHRYPRFRSSRRAIREDLSRFEDLPLHPDVLRAWVDRAEALIRSRRRGLRGFSLEEATCSMAATLFCITNDFQERIQALRELAVVSGLPESGMLLAAYRALSIDTDGLHDAEGLAKAHLSLHKAVGTHMSAGRLLTLAEGTGERFRHMVGSGRTHTHVAVTALDRQDLLRYIRESLPSFTTLPHSERETIEVAQLLRLEVVNQGSDWPLLAATVSADGATDRCQGFVYLRATEWEAIRVFLLWHELAHWMMGADETGNKRASSIILRTWDDRAEELANHVAMYALWSAPVLAWVAMQACAARYAQTQELPIQPPETHLNPRDPKDVESLVGYLLQRYPTRRPPSGNSLRVVRTFASLRLAAYNELLRSGVFFRSPGVRNWFSAVQSGSSLEAPLLACLSSDPSVAWGILTLGDMRVEQCSAAFCAVVGLAASEIYNSGCASLIDDQVDLVRLPGRRLTSLAIVEEACQILTLTRQPLVYWVLYKIFHARRPTKRRALCRLQVIPMLTADGALLRTIGIVEKVGELTVTEAGAIVASPTTSAVPRSTTLPGLRGLDNVSSPKKSRPARRPNG